VRSEKFERFGDCGHRGRRRPNQRLETLESSRVETAVGFLGHRQVSIVASFQEMMIPTFSRSTSVSSSFFKFWSSSL